MELIWESFDVTTILFTVTCVFLPLRFGIFLAILCGLYKETATMYPAGLYISSYLAFALLFDFIRSSVSWRSFFPWFLTLNIFLVFIASVKGILFLSYSVASVPTLLWTLTLQTILGCLLATMMAYAIFQYYKKIYVRW